MAVRLRLRRMGRKKRPFYRIVAADSRAPRNGRFIEMVGTYNPLMQPQRIEFKEDRIFYWLKNGAQPTDTVKNLFQKKGLWLKWDLMRNGADEVKIEEEFKKWEVLQIEKMKRLEEKARKKNEQAKKTEEPVEEEEVKVEETAEASSPEQAEKVEAPAETEAPQEEKQAADKSEEKAGQPEDPEAEEKTGEESAAETKADASDSKEETEEKKTEEAESKKD